MPALESNCCHTFVSKINVQFSVGSAAGFLPNQTELPWAQCQLSVFQCSPGSVFCKRLRSVCPQSPSWLWKHQGRVSRGGHRRGWLQGARAWQLQLAALSPEPSVLSSFQAAFTPLQIISWRLARQRAAENQETALSDNFTATC